MLFEYKNTKYLVEYQRLGDDFKINSIRDINADCSDINLKEVFENVGVYDAFAKEFIFASSLV